MHTHRVANIEDGIPHSAANPASFREAKAPFTHAQLFTVTCGLLGLQLCWAVQIGYVTKTLLELGLPQRFVSYAWLAGPISGIVVQPLVGMFSDRCTSRFGRRRPFLVAGALSSAAALNLFANAQPLGTLLGDPVASAAGTEDEFVVMPRALVIAVVAFWVLDFAINVSQGPIRALLADVVPPEQHDAGNSYFALSTGIGNFSGSLLGSFRLSETFTFFEHDVQALYAIASIILLLSMGVTVAFTKEEPLRTARPTLTSPRLGGLSRTSTAYDSLPSRETYTDGVASQPVSTLSFLEAARKAPHPFWPAFVVQCFVWFGWFTLYVFATSWVGAEVYNGSYSAAAGSPERELYDAGVRMGNFALAMQSVVTIAMAPMLPHFIKWTTSQFVYLISSAVFGVSLSLSLVLTEKWQAPFAAVAIASTGFAWAVTMTIPWSLMGTAVATVSPQHAGVYYTLFNLSQCFPEIAVSLVAEEVERVTQKQASVLGLGGVSVFIAAALIIVLGVGKPNTAAS